MEIGSPAKAQRAGDAARSTDAARSKQLLRQERQEKAAQERWEREAKLQVRSALSSLPLFRGCDEDLLDAATNIVEFQVLKESEEFDVTEDAPMLVVVSGALQVCIGTGPVVDFGPASVINVIGALGVRDQAESYRPNCPTSPTAILGNQKDERSLHEPPVHTLEGITCRVVRNLCPYAPQQLKAEDCVEKLSGWLRLTVSAVTSTTVATLATEPFQELFFGTGKETLCANRDALVNRWLTILRSFVLPRAPPEVAWALAEQSKDCRYSAGDDICLEGHAGEDAEALIVLGSGVADVLKIMPPGVEDANSVTHQSSAGGTDARAAEASVVGELCAGAIIGDIMWAGAGVPRAGTVRARTTMDVITIPRSGFLSCLERFPGITSAMKQRARHVQTHVQPGLPSKMTVFAMNSIFSKCSESFLQELAKFAERRKCHCREVLKRRGDDDTTIWFIEFGLCSVSEIENVSGSLVIGPGTVFGEKTFFGQSSAAVSTVRVLTPFVLVLQLQQQAFRNVLKRYPEERDRLPIDQHNTGYSRDTDISTLNIFKTSGNAFLSMIKSSIAFRCYMPGQTVTVEGALDTGSMFVLRGGKTCVISKGILRGQIPGDTFGELAMLGVVAFRAASVVATTFCRLLEIPRATFMIALDQHPDERGNFAELSSKHEDSAACIAWPMFAGAPSDLLYHVNLQTTRRITSVGEWISHKGEPLPRDTAVLVCCGSIKVLGENGHELLELKLGDCHNVQVLLGYSPARVSLVPSTSCEVQLMSKSQFDIIMKSCPYAKQAVQRGIVNELTRKTCEVKHGVPRNSPNVLKFATIFRSAPSAFMREIYDALDAQMFRPNETIIRQGETGDSMYLLVDGEAYIDVGNSQRGKLTHPVVGASVALGIASCYTLTVRVAVLCLAYALRQQPLLRALEKHPSARCLFGNALDEVRFKGLELRERFNNRGTFKDVDQEFLNMLCRDAEDVFYGPGEDICIRGTACELGQSSLWVLLSGGATLHAANDVLMGSLSPGTAFGEGGGLGINKTRPVTVRAWTRGVVHCARLQGSVLKLAVTSCPKQCEAVARQYAELQEELHKFEVKRDQWVESVLVPALAENPIFKYFSKDLLISVAKPLEEEAYECGDIIVEVGQPADSMILILDGEAELHSSRGELVGRVLKGAVIGEIAVLGLLTVRTARVVAAAPKTWVSRFPPSPACKVLRVASTLLKDAIAQPTANSARQAIARILSQKQYQVANGLPMRAIFSDLGVDHVVSRAVALHAEQLCLRSNDIWQPVSDDSPCGPHIGVLVRGHGSVVLMGIGEERIVMQLDSGCVFSEGVIANYDGRFRAATNCELYRVRMVDIMLATCSDPEFKKWFLLLTKRNRELSDQLRLRLEGAKGVLSSKMRSMRASTRSLLARVGVDILGGEGTAVGNARSEATNKLLRTQSAAVGLRRPESAKSVTLVRPSSPASGKLAHADSGKLAKTLTSFRPASGKVTHADSGKFAKTLTSFMS